MSPRPRGDDCDKNAGTYAGGEWNNTKNIPDTQNIPDNKMNNQVPLNEPLQSVCTEGEDEKRFSVSLNGSPLIVKDWHRFFKFYSVYLSALRISVVSEKLTVAVATNRLHDLYNNHLVDVKHEFDNSNEVEAFTTYDTRFLGFLIFGPNLLAGGKIYLIRVNDEYFSLELNGITINVIPFAISAILLIVGSFKSYGFYIFIYITFCISYLLLAIEKKIFIETRVLKQKFQTFVPRNDNIEYFVTQPKLPEWCKKN